MAVDCELICEEVVPKFMRQGQPSPPYVKMPLDECHTAFKAEQMTGS